MGRLQIGISLILTEISMEKLVQNPEARHCNTSVILSSRAHLPFFIISGFLAGDKRGDKRGHATRAEEHRRKEQEVRRRT
jgi:hypothetical protein